MRAGLGEVTVTLRRVGRRSVPCRNALATSQTGAPRVAPPPSKWEVPAARPLAQTGVSMSARLNRPVCLIVDDFLDDPDAVRRVALAQRFVKMHSAGLRTVESFLHLAPYKQAFERLLGRAVTNFDDNAANGRFQLCTAADAIPYHSDSQSYAGVLFLTPGAPLDAGLSFFRSRRSGMRGRCSDPELMAQTFGRGAEFDRSCWEEVDR